MVLATGFFFFFFLSFVGGRGRSSQSFGAATEVIELQRKKEVVDLENSFIKPFINFSSVHKIKSQISWDHFSDASLILWGGS